jgi:hypothetical protein
LLHFQCSKVSPQPWHVRDWLSGNSLTLTLSNFFVFALFYFCFHGFYNKRSFSSIFHRFVIQPNAAENLWKNPVKFTGKWYLKGFLRDGDVHIGWLSKNLDFWLAWPILTKRGSFFPWEGTLTGSVDNCLQRFRSKSWTFWGGHPVFLSLVAGIHVRYGLIEHALISFQVLKNVQF